MPIILILLILLAIIGALVMALGIAPAKPAPPTQDKPPVKHPPVALHAHLCFEPYRLDDEFTFDMEQSPKLKNTKLFEDILTRLKQRHVAYTHTPGALIAHLTLDGVPFVLELEELHNPKQAWHLWLQSTIATPATEAELEYIVKQLLDSLKFLEVSTPKVMTHAQWEAAKP